MPNVRDAVLGLYIQGVWAKYSKVKIPILIGLAIFILVVPGPWIMGEITKRNLTNKCEYFFQQVNKDLKKAEQATQDWKYFIDATQFAYQFTNAGIDGKAAQRDCVSLINRGFTERVTGFYAALVEHNRISNSYGTNAPPPPLPYKSAPEGSDVFGAFCDSPAPLFLRFNTECEFFEDMNINTYTYFR